MKVEKKKEKSMLTAFLQYTLEDRQGLVRLNIIAQAWTNIIHWFTSIKSSGPIVQIFLT